MAGRKSFGANHLQMLLPAASWDPSHFENPESHRIAIEIDVFELSNPRVHDGPSALIAWRVRAVQNAPACVATLQERVQLSVNAAALTGVPMAVVVHAVRLAVRATIVAVA